MNDPKYMKTVSVYADSLYDKYEYVSLSLEEYKKKLKLHIDSVSASIKALKKYHKNVEDIKVSIIIDRGSYDNDSIEYETRITAKIPMNEKERAVVDQTERNRRINTETFEKRQLAELLKKYPEVK